MKIYENAKFQALKRMPMPINPRPIEPTFMLYSNDIPKNFVPPLAASVHSRSTMLADKQRKRPIQPASTITSGPSSTEQKKTPSQQEDGEPESSSRGAARTCDDAVAVSPSHPGLIGSPCC